MCELNDSRVSDNWPTKYSSAMVIARVRRRAGTTASGAPNLRIDLARAAVANVPTNQALAIDLDLEERYGGVGDLVLIYLCVK